MKRVVFTICLLCLFLTGCSNSPSRKKSRLDFSRVDIYRTTRSPYSTPGLTGMDVPRIKPMKLPPEKPGQ